MQSDRSILWILAIGLLFALAFVRALYGQDAPRKGSPFDAVRWNEQQPQVQVAGKWYVPESIEGVAVSEILTYCQKRWPRGLRKRFNEDLVEAMQGMGHQLPTVVTLVLVEVGSKKRVELKGIAVTAEKRAAIWHAGIHAHRVVSHQQWQEDLEDLKAKLQEQFAYLELGDFDWSRALKQLAKQPKGELEVDQLSQQVDQFMCQFRDGHAYVGKLPRPNKYAPYLLQETVDGIIAFLPDRSNFVDPEHPKLHKINGVHIEEWMRRAAVNVVRGSPQLVRHRTLRMLRSLAKYTDRSVLEKPLTLELRSLDGKSSSTKTMDWVTRPPSYSSWQRYPGLHREGIGYLQISSMDSNQVDAMRRRMNQLRDVNALIVDVRGNGGGSRAHLLALAGYLTGPDEGYWVGNVAQYKLAKKFRSDHLEARFMYTEDSDHWNVGQRKAIAQFRKGFKPEWKPQGSFSDWHYLVLGQTGHPEEYFFDKPVIILSDAGCFSATDIFLAALKGRPRITLMGEASGGGSARSQGLTLRHSKIAIRCASMASFQPNGQLYDGRGVQVDVKVPTRASDLLKSGKDSVLQAAVQRLKLAQ